MLLHRLAGYNARPRRANGFVWFRPSSCRRSLLSNVAAALQSRAVIEITGADAKALLQGLMTNDMSLLDKGSADGAAGRPCISAAFLNPKGRVLGDALVTRSPRHVAKNKPGYLLDCPLSIAEGLKSHLKLYKLRSKVKIKDATALYDVFVSGVHDPARGSEKGDEKDVSPRESATGGALARFSDPRSAALGVRLIRPKDGEDSDGVSWPGSDEVVPEERYHALRMLNGVGEGSELLDAIPLEANLDLLGSISFAKGCYVGQELTARTQFKGFVRKRMLPVMFPAEGLDGVASPVGNASDVPADALVGSSWWPGGSGGAPPLSGCGVVNRAAGGEKLGTLVAVSAEYNVGLALLRLGKVLPLGSANQSEGQGDSKAGPAVDCRLVEEGSEESESRRCLPLMPVWWPVDLNPATGKVPT